MMARDENADNSPIDYAKELSNQSRELVNRVKATLNRPKQEILPMLVECNMDANEAINRLLSQGSSIQEGKKQDKKKEDVCDSWPDGVSSKFQNWEFKDGEHYDYCGDRRGGNQFESDGGEFRKSGQHYDYYGDRSGGNKFISDGREVSKDGDSYGYYGVRGGGIYFDTGTANVQGPRNHLADSPAISAARRDQRLPEFRNDNDYYGVQGGGHKFNSDGVANVQGPRNHLAGSPAMSAARRDQFLPEFRNDNDYYAVRETTNLQGTCNYLAAPPTMSVARRDQRLPEFTNHNDYYGVRGGGHKFNSDETNVQGIQSHLAGNEMHKTMSSARRYQLLEAARRDRHLVINQNLRNDDYGGSRLLYEEDNTKNDESYQGQRLSFEHNRAKDHSAPAVTGFQKLSLENEENKPVLIIPDRLQVKTPELQHLTFGTFGSEMNRYIQPNGLPSQSLNDDSKYIHHSSEFADDASLKHLYTRDAESSEEEDHRLRRNVANEQKANQICFDAAQNDQSSSNFDKIEPAQENHYKSSSVTDFTFDTSHWLNQKLSPSEPIPQTQNVLDQHAYKRKPYSQSSALLDNQALFAKDSTYSLFASPLGHKPASSMAEALKTATSYVPQKYREAKNHHNSQPKVPSGHYSNIMNSPYNMSPSTLQQHGGSSTNNTFRHQSLPATPPQYRNSNPSQVALSILQSIYGYRNQQSPSSRQSQQQEEEQTYRASLNQQNTRTDPSNQTQQQLRGRYKY